MANDLQNTPQNVTSDEKLLAMLAHLSIFLGGIILPIILWATQKDKSKFVSFHSLQAIFYHIAFGVIIIVYMIIFGLAIVVSGIGFGAFKHVSKENNEMPVFMLVMIIIFNGSIFLLAFSGIGYAIYLAIKSYQGYLIKIPVIGKIIYKKVYGES